MIDYRVYLVTDDPSRYSGERFRCQLFAEMTARPVERLGDEDVRNRLRVRGVARHDLRMPRADDASVRPFEDDLVEGPSRGVTERAVEGRNA